MRRAATTLLSILLAVLVTTPAFAQAEGDYRTRDSGDWSNPQIWERYNGSAWAAVATAPTGSETITVVATDERTDSVFVDVETTITGQLVNQGIVDTEQGNLIIGDGGVYEHARDEGKVPPTVWADGSTMRVTGVTATAPEDRNQDYYHLVFDTPDLLSNLNMGFDETTIRGDITVLETGFGRWYLTTAQPEDTSTVTILGDVIVEGGAFSVQGTSNALTTFIVDHYGDVMVTGGNFSISRGSQGNGTTTWTLHEGDFTMSNATTQSSTLTPSGARFVFAREGTQTLTLGEGIDFSSLPIEVASGTTLDMGLSTLAGSGHFTLHEGANLATALPGGVDAIFTADFVGPVTFEDDNGFIFNGTEAQVTSTRMPATVAELVIDNEAGVTLSQETTITDVLRLVSGVFDNTIPFTLAEGATISEEGGSLLVSVSSEAETGLPETFYVEQNYPNPFNPTTTFRYGLPAAADVTVEVYNALGQRVRTLHLGYQGAGVHQVQLQAGDLGSGAYVYRVVAGDQVETGRMLLVK